MVYVKFITPQVAFSPMPYPQDIPELSKQFQAVVVLTYEYELYYEIEAWKKNNANVEVFYSPIDDFSAPTLEQLIEIVRWIEKKVNEGKKVLIHCLGGSGRSGTIAVAYLIYSQKLPLREALSKVRQLKPSAVETQEQMDVLKALERISL